MGVGVGGWEWSGILNMEMTEVTNDEISPSKGFIVELSLIIFRALVLETLWMPNPKEVKYLHRADAHIPV